MVKKSIFLIIFMIVVGILFWISQKPKLESFASLKIGNTVIQAEFADTPEKRVRGLSGREKLGENEGILFVFNEVGHHGIWMKDMNFPIDIIWARPVRDHARPVRDKYVPISPEQINSKISNGARAGAPEGPVGRAISNGVKFNLQIVDIAENVTPDTYPQVFKPKGPSSYVLEVNAGFAAKNKIKIGDTLQIE